MAEKLETPEYIEEIRQAHDIENAVNKILEKNNITKPPVNVLEIARKLDFKIFSAHLKGNISGIMVDSKEMQSSPLDYQRFIVINSEDYKTRKIFTIAHELGHFALHCTNDTDFFERHLESDDVKPCDQSEERQRLEEEANKFAANLLMPKKFMDEFINNSNNRNNLDKLTDEIKNEFLVSENAIARRFKELNINFNTVE
jgi:Zn-dependent peptidase ImmA (M78 family)